MTARDALASCAADVARVLAGKAAALDMTPAEAAAAVLAFQAWQYERTRAAPMPAEGLRQLVGVVDAAAYVAGSTARGVADALAKAAAGVPQDSPTAAARALLALAASADVSTWRQPLPAILARLDDYADISGALDVTPAD